MSQNQGPGWGPPPVDQPPSEQGSGQWVPPPPGQTGYPSKFCHACASSIDARAEICPKCGVRQPGSATGTGKSRALAAALALFFGFLGIHKFYLGQVAWGVLYLIFFWTYIPGIIAWFEALYFLTRSNQDWARDHGGSVQSPNGVAMGCLWILALLPLLAIGAIFILIFFGNQVSSILSEIGTAI